MISVIFSNTQLVLRTAIISFNIEVLQGACCSGYLFIIYIDRLIRRVRECYATDDILGALSIRLLMDNTTLLAMTREA